MAGRTDAEALRAFYEPIQRSISYLTGDVLSVVPTGSRIYVLTFGSPSAPKVARLFGDKRLSLRSLQRLRLIEAEGERGPIKVSTLSYAYTLADESTGQELLTFHWHPQAREPRDPAAQVLARDPHMHIGSAATSDDRLLNRHMPTERLSIEDVLILAVEMGATPRDGWQDVILSARERFRAFRTWPRPAGS